MPKALPGSKQEKLNKSHPAAARVKLGDTVSDLIDQVNALTAAMNTLAAKLNADAGVTDVNYVGVTATTIATLENR